MCGTEFMPFCECVKTVDFPSFSQHCFEKTFVVKSDQKEFQFFKMYLNKGTK